MITGVLLFLSGTLLGAITGIYLGLHERKHLRARCLYLSALLRDASTSTRVIRPREFRPIVHPPTRQS